MSPTEMQQTVTLIIVLVGLGVWVGGGIAATRYLVTGKTDEKITPIFYVPGIVFGPVTILLAFLTWLFQGKA